MWLNFKAFQFDVVMQLACMIRDLPTHIPARYALTLKEQ